MKFLSSKDRGKIKIFGVPYDSTTCFRPGARFGADGIRLFSENLEDFSPELEKSLEDLDFTDVGNLELPASPEKMVEEIYSFVKEVEIPVMLGGEHSVTFPVVKALSERFSRLTVVQFDAHADLREEYSGTPYSHACVMRRILELPNTQLVQVGIRSGTREEFELIKLSDRITYVKDVLELPSVLSEVETPIYFTVDIDFFDPSYAPGTGTPEHCGASPVDFFKAVYKLPAASVVGFDVVEVSPPYDPSGITQALGAKIVRELLLKFWG
ncbi:agmatinase [Thermovibrio guaymasensis]|uniref:Agmatinase n=1 Tax=Thermovibrio guaymasensis TaxID=240167 RepID=A0A420W7Q3_9BACT|nr:agmatinase [Thermovibrio guaymasensis]RKQ63350.1 agmatinase [Thermovibrio guaymasensis]